MEDAYDKIMSAAAKQSQPPRCIMISSIGVGGSSWLIEMMLMMIGGRASFNDFERAHIGLLIEQPCQTYEQSLKIRRMCNRPFVLDEVIDDMNDLLRAIADDALDVLVIKLSHTGGLSKAREMIAVALHSGIKLRIEDTVGAEFIRASVAHLASTIPPNMLLGAYPHPAPIALGSGETELNDGYINVGDSPGLGVTPDYAVLGDPIAVYS